MKILVDADACPVVWIVERIAQKNGIPCVLLCDTNHVSNAYGAASGEKRENGKGETSFKGTGETDKRG